ncbi:phosphate ABC transporter substrate-binding protein PstS [Lichenihabitans sp. Uapishka_5]|uniref:phosphate ABC transporter substrate-binding protein PstS n=1 Tax=Lichenihabitans sp. Uapishka_5 TaxID=3037302 RepID=UPI0029E80D60|nr:phosphate ABC transporter substrate-binding protein PstS [Lichenihabitans sp. Uapishka_5]MDX7949709.1 phosphate ABC transporter substrate-binding protein PstS [Lichenihabitans sp. Uapishka_5]
MFNPSFKRAALLASVFAAGVATAQAADISGAGATFPYPVYAKWAQTYKNATGTGVNYQSIGSGGGIKQIKAKTVTFGATDAPLQAKDLDAAGLEQWPMVMGGIVPVINVDGIKAGDVVIDGPALAGIFMGTITKWNDAALKKLNPSVALPDMAIAVVHRSDGSGTTFNFTNYLSKASADWKSKVGENTAVEWPVGLGAKGNEGVANNVANTKGSIGYVEYAFARQNNLTTTKMVNKDGKVVAPTVPAFQAAAASADWAHAPGFYQILTDQSGAESWPLTAATFILMQKQPADTAAAAEAIKFFGWAFEKGDAEAESLDYIPMPGAVKTLIKKAISTDIKGADGKPVVTLQ